MWSYTPCTCLSSYASGLSSTTVAVTSGGIGVGSFSSEGARTFVKRDDEYSTEGNKVG
jgi:hypothetical protein